MVFRLGTLLAPVVSRAGLSDYKTRPLDTRVFVDPGYAAQWGDIPAYQNAHARSCTAAAKRVDSDILRLHIAC